MTKNTALFATLGLVMLATLLHIYATEHHYYFYFWWWHFIVHGMAGASVGAAAVTFWKFKFTAKWKIYLLAVLAALVVGIGWEAYEKFFNLIFVIPVSYRADLMLDLFADTLGALISAPFFIKFGTWLIEA